MKVQHWRYLSAVELVEALSPKTKGHPTGNEQWYFKSKKEGWGEKYDFATFYAHFIYVLL